MCSLLQFAVCFFPTTASAGGFSFSRHHPVTPVPAPHHPTCTPTIMHHQPLRIPTVAQTSRCTINRNADQPLRIPAVTRTNRCADQPLRRPTVAQINLGTHQPLRNQPHWAPQQPYGGKPSTQSSGIIYRRRLDCPRAPPAAATAPPVGPTAAICV